MIKAAAMARVVVAAAVALLAGSAQAAEPANGVAFQPRNGWFAETQLGVFTTFGGLKPASNAQPYVALSFGFDLPVPNLSAFVTVAHGYNAGSCRDVIVKSGESVCNTYKFEDGSPWAAPDNFSVIPAEVGARYSIADIMPRLKATLAATVGYSLLTPQITETAPGGSPHAGFGVGVSYATRLPGLDIGAEVLARVAFAPMIPSLSAYPRIRYVF